MVILVLFLLLLSPSEKAMSARFDTWSGWVWVKNTCEGAFPLPSFAPQSNIQFNWGITKQVPSLALLRPTSVKDDEGVNGVVEVVTDCIDFLVAGKLVLCDRNNRDKIKEDTQKWGPILFMS